MAAAPSARAGRLWKSKADFFRPFRLATVNPPDESAGVFDPSLCDHEFQDADIQDLNASLVTLISLFPQVQPEVFREMLLSISDESRLQLVTEHLLQRQAKWVRGRYRTSTAAFQGNPANAPTTAGSTEAASGGDVGLSHHDMFRSISYQKAAKQVLYQEFKTLSHSTIKGVLAERNFSYTRSRPVLQQIASRSWSFPLSGLWSRWSSSQARSNHPFILRLTDDIIEARPRVVVKKTGSDELDRELYELFVADDYAKQRDEQILADFAAASLINTAEAAEANALFDCECCFDSIPFEKVSACDALSHILCLECVRRTASEAVYGQGWAKTVDLHRGTLRCFAPTSQGCDGCLPPEMVRRALLNGGSERIDDPWQNFQAKLTTDTITQSGISLHRCPFCEYAEVDEIPRPQLRQPLAIWHHIGSRSTVLPRLILLVFLGSLMVFTVPITALLSLGYILTRYSPLEVRVLQRSWTRVFKYRGSTRFSCRNPRCLKASCFRCRAMWRDPHTCFESEKTSLRTALEASATAAIKRTCPRCLLSFVKSSGCNKLVCNCGYTMCYICRQQITSKEGYAHFCQHFRPHGGRCTECERCDLYGDEDEDASIRQAIDAAERAWKENQNGKEVVDDQLTQLMMESVAGHRHGETWIERFLDAILDACLV